MDAKKQEREAHAQWREGFEAQQQRAERKRAHASRRERRVAFVAEQLQHWRDARDLRALVAEVRARLRAETLPDPKWLAWASSYADEIDPVQLDTLQGSAWRRQRLKTKVDSVMAGGTRPTSGRQGRGQSDSF